MTAHADAIYRNHLYGHSVIAVELMCTVCEREGSFAGQARVINGGSNVTEVPNRREFTAEGVSQADCNASACGLQMH